MRYLTDLHLHSKFSRATSKDMTFDVLAAWAKVKGLSLLATADFTHPEWLFLTKQKLEPAGNGFFRLKKPLSVESEHLRGFSVAPDDVHFILSSELSFVYSKKGKVRKIHLLLFAPDLETVEKINHRLVGIGNLRSDGRPILGLDAKLFVRMVADINSRCVIVPAHIWTPWFSLFGANSGFEAVEECFEEMTPFIFALETGLSSDPRMNGRISALDRYALISNSDAHSPWRIGREANAFETEFSFKGLMEAIRSRDSRKFLYTVEFFPEEGKYHADGHRKCGVALSPKESLAGGNLCPSCGKKLTIGVLHRVEELADRTEPAAGTDRIPFKSLIPLNEIIGEACGRSSECGSVWDQYFHFIRELGDEHRILTEVPENEIRRLAPERVGGGIGRMRKGLVRIIPGYDGEYGRISVFDDSEEPSASAGQITLF